MLKWLIIGAVIAAFFLWRRLTMVQPEQVRAWLQGGALVVDVRSETEFQERHLPGAINLPLGRLREGIGQHAPNKDQVILLHCLSGGRSGVGRGVLKAMGYRNAHNLGSYARAEKIVGEAPAGKSG
jgi:phage shock protein E